MENVARDEIRRASSGGRPLEVIVVGAGLAGLVAAYELEQAGHTVHLLEADPRHVGGRVRTARTSDGAPVELGAMRIPAAHTLVLGYVRELGLSVRPFLQHNPEGYYHLRGRRERVRDLDRLLPLYPLAEHERAQTPAALWVAAIVKVLERLTAEERAQLSATAPSSPVVRSLDRLTLGGAFQRAGHSAGARELLAAAFCLASSLDEAASEHLREERDQVWLQGFFEIPGGMEQLPHGLAARLRRAPDLGCRLLGIAQDAARGRVTARYCDSEGERALEADALICTLPLPLLRALDVAPAFSAAKQHALAEIRYESATKVFARCQRRFWELDDGIYGGRSISDGAAGVTYYPSDNVEARDPAVSDRPAMLLASYTTGAAARRMAAMSGDRRARLVGQHLALLHQGAQPPGVVGELISWSWDDQPFARGAFAQSGPGQHALYAGLVAAEGRVHLAGEHCSLSRSWMQGAMESGLRAALAVVLQGRKHQRQRQA